MIIKGRAIVISGQPGPANSLSIGSVTSGPAAVTITGTPPNQVLNFALPPGADGTIPTFSIGTISTLAPGSAATVTITGTAPNYVLNFGLPAANAMGHLVEDFMTITPPTVAWVRAIGGTGGSSVDIAVS